MFSNHVDVIAVLALRVKSMCSECPHMHNYPHVALLAVLANFAGFPTLFFQIVFSLESARSFVCGRVRSSG